MPATKQPKQEFSEKARTYAAEWRVQDILHDYPGETYKRHGASMVVPVERKFGSLDHVQVYCDFVLGLAAVRRAYPRAAMPVRVRHRAGDGAAHYERGEQIIAVHDPKYGMPGWAMREIVVLHELAHHLSENAGHHAEFRAAFIFLLNECVADEIGWLLMVNFYDEGLQIG